MTPPFAVVNRNTKTYLNERELGISKNCKLAEFPTASKAQTAIAESLKRFATAVVLVATTTPRVCSSYRDIISFRLHDKTSKAFVCEDELFTEEEYEGRIAVFYNEEEAHEARFLYEKEQEGLGIEKNIEVIAICNNRAIYTA